jgi:preprotein translocase subunit SecA
MAGRGTDIRLEPEVALAGGLHVIVSQPHAAARIDRQLIGRCGRQGDPGSARVYASPDDEILVQAFGHERAHRIRRSAATGAGDRWLLRKLRQAQRRVSRIHRLERARLTAQEASLADSMQQLGLDPHLDPLQPAGVRGS